MKHEVLSDGITVWVNSGDTGHCLGRFGRGGIDVHHDLDAQMDKGQCLDCTHERPTIADWDRFVKGMAEQYGLRISAKHQPRWLKGS